jgi:hypothetical protein
MREHGGCVCSPENLWGNLRERIFPLPGARSVYNRALTGTSVGCRSYRPSLDAVVRSSIKPSAYAHADTKTDYHAGPYRIAVAETHPDGIAHTASSHADAYAKPEAHSNQHPRGDADAFEYRH